MTYDGHSYAAAAGETSVHLSDYHYAHSAQAESSSDDIDVLKKQASRLSHLLQVMPAGVIVIDGQGIVRQANGQAKSLLGEPLEGQLWRTIIALSLIHI